MPISIVVGNWKMNMSVAEATALATAIRRLLTIPDGTLALVCPPFPALAAVAEALAGSRIGVGAQNVHPDISGAFTGEVSTTMLSEICSHVIVGHSERRSLFGETDDFINRKARAVSEAGMTPILCVGESMEDRDSGRAEQVVEFQVRKGLTGVHGAVVAYEPVWAIGAGTGATPETAQEIMAYIREVLGDLSSPHSASEVSLLYGGSVNHSNIQSYTAQDDIDGVLVGGASLDSESFCKIVEFVHR
ncbi:triose-phosphate isomerase [Dehalococcoidia bacterium]|nr:triose-phosphate isomerase [Dehalococcoidia bacterium]